LHEPKKSSNDDRCRQKQHAGAGAVAFNRIRKSANPRQRAHLRFLRFFAAISFERRPDGCPGIRGHGGNGCSPRISRIDADECENKIELICLIRAHPRDPWLKTELGCGWKIAM
jgi:hypothetical protein